ncbi:hypothetical protein BDD12DRAFT_883365 [Trichophaea hybrida]|nr:hypothetical protein BDD12DRAFT_883365 [Trichophaea hybrida]
MEYYTESTGVIDDDFWTKEIINNDPTRAVCLGDLTKPGVRCSYNVKDFVDALRDLSVPGPLDLMQNYLQRSFIARGGSFNVYENFICGWESDPPWVLRRVAAKRCHFIVESDQRIDLSTEEYRKQIHDMYLEVLALQHPNLKKHRNIVKMYGWTLDYSRNTLPVLVLELAIADLRGFLERDEHNSAVKHQLCLDMSAGLDALHESGIIHADFKSSNVLIFSNDLGSENVPYIAKLADFGFSTLECKSFSDNLIHVTGWSDGWQAPEIDMHRVEKRPILSEDYRRADRYSWGLTVWSTLCFNGQTPPDGTKSDASDRAVASIQELRELSKTSKETFKTALKLTLNYEASGRPKSVGNLLRDETAASKNWAAEYDIAKDTEDAIENEGEHAIHPWGLPDIQQFLLEGSKKSYKDYGASMSGAELFSIFLLNSYSSIAYEIPPSLDSVLIKALFDAAHKGFTPAQAVVSRVLASYELPWPSDYDQSLKITWLVNGASSGSMIATNVLQEVDAVLAEKALVSFREGGGYQEFYSTEERRQEWNRAMDDLLTRDFGANAVSQLSIIDSEENKPTLELNTLEKTSIYTTGLSRQSMLHMACLAGCYKSVKTLCSQGIDASIPADDGTSCLHWLHVFPTDQIEDTARILVSKGADINAFVRSCVINYHFPFSWPPGTPLHWAVSASNTTAISTLLKLRADPNIRNLCDPYMYDMNVRDLYYEGHNTQGSFSKPAPTYSPEGFSPIDLAVASYDWRTLLSIARENLNGFDVSSADEEGYMAIHRLQYNRLGRTFRQDRFWSVVFAGPPSVRRREIFHTIQILQSMGANIDALTSPHPDNPRRKTEDNQRPGTLTPLMLAARHCDLDAVVSLLSCGANPNVRNNLGWNALCLLPESGDPTANPATLESIVETLIKHGTDIRSNLDWTPLSSAIYSGSLKVVSMVLEAGSDPRQKTRGMDDMAWLMAQYDVINQLAEPAICHGHEKVRRYDAELCRLLKDYLFTSSSDFGISDCTDRQGGTLLHYAALSILPRVSEFLVTRHANVNAYRESQPEKIVNSKGKWRVSGTPLDALLYTKYNVMKKVERTYQMYAVSSADFQFVFSLIDEVESILLAAGARHMAALGCTDGPFVG